MAIALEGTPSVIVDGGSYTAETTGSDRLVVFSCAGHIGGDVLCTGADMGAQAATEGKLPAAGRKAPTGLYYIKEADIPTGSQTITLSVSAGSLDDSQITCYTLSGVDQTTPIKATGQDNG